MKAYWFYLICGVSYHWLCEISVISDEARLVFQLFVKYDMYGLGGNVLGQENNEQLFKIPVS